MPRFFSYMVLLGFVALIAGTVAFIRNSPSSPSRVSSPGNFSRKPVGDTAISHGGPTATRSDAYAASPTPGTIGIGQEMMVGAPTVLHPAIPDDPTLASSPATRPPIPAGTIVTVVAIAPAAPPDTRQTTTYYKIQLVDGQTGWVSEHVLRPVNTPAQAPPGP